MNFIILTDLKNNTPVFLNVNTLVAMIESSNKGEDFTEILTTGPTTLSVCESPSEIIKMINEKIEMEKSWERKIGY